MAGEEARAPNGGEPPLKKQKPGDHSEAFVAVFDTLLEHVMGDIDQLTDISTEIKAEIKAYYDKCIRYTVVGGKMTRGLTVVKGFEVLAGRELSQPEFVKACVLGWCVEWLQAFFLVADDVMDKSITRRGAPCWYKLAEVTQANAINDSLMLEILIYRILRHHFSQEQYYLQLIELFHDTTFQTEIGQHLDTNSTPFDSGMDLNRFTLSRYQAIVKYKTAFYSFYLSCALAMVLAGETDTSRFATAQRICLELGEYFQVQDDYLDCYGDPQLIGKIGTDIRDAKCSWLVCQALLLSNESQRQTIKDYYGKWDDESEAKIKSLYRELDLQRVFNEYEESTKTKIDGLIATVQPEQSRELFNFLLAKIYKREK
eukprot:c6781_g1_i1.p1 GENE.c6781_g1_i1~~c6781_g1_i1.p1  ORF type:complete len:388 (+),score=92.22 c6781_g1_i1:53-1165(+)